MQGHLEVKHFQPKANAPLRQQDTPQKHAAPSVPTINATAEASLEHELPTGDFHPSKPAAAGGPTAP